MVILLTSLIGALKHLWVKKHDILNLLLNITVKKNGGVIIEPRMVTFWQSL